MIQPSPLQDFEEIEQRLPAQYFSQGIFTIEEDGLPLVTRGGSAPGREDELAVVFRDGPMIAHYFHFMELLIGCHLLCERYFSTKKVKSIYFGMQPWNNLKQNEVQQKLLSTIYPGAEVYDKNRTPESSQIANVLVIDRSSARKLTTINKFLDPFLQMEWSAGATLRERVLSMIAPVTKPDGGRKRAGYVLRNPPRTLSESLENTIISLVSETYELVKLDFASMSWAEQVRSVRDLDLLFGVHGNGLTNVCWMKPGAKVIEFFPPGVHHYDYQVFCEIFGLNYFGIEGKSTGGFIFRDWTRDGPAYGEHPIVNAPVSELPAVRIHSFLNW